MAHLVACITSSLPQWAGKSRARLRSLHSHSAAELCTAVLIACNFLTIILQTTIDPARTAHPDVFEGIEVFFLSAFTAELLVNLCGHRLRSFAVSTWNKFDLALVVIGWLSLADLGLPSSCTWLRGLRSFRACRLFRRTESMSRLLASLARSVYGVAQACMLLALVLAMFALLSVEFWAAFGAGGRITNEGGVELDYSTTRGQDFGFEYFDNFPKAFFTMIQVAFGESWSEAVARPLMSTPDSLRNAGAALFFVAVQFFGGVILLNMIVAVVLGVIIKDAVADDTRADAEAPGRAAAPPRHHEDYILEPASPCSFRVDAAGRPTVVDGLASSARVLHTLPPIEGPAEKADAPCTDTRHGQRWERVGANLSEMRQDVQLVKAQVALLLAAISRGTRELPEAAPF